MKRLLSILMLAALLISLAACGGTTVNETTEPVTDPATDPVTDPVTEPVETDAPESTPETDAPTETQSSTDALTKEPSVKGSCSSVVMPSLAFMALMAAGMAVVLKKKED